MVGFQTWGRIDGLILMLPPKGKGFFLYTHLCVHPFIYLLYFFISMFIYLYILIYICRSISKYTLYIISIYLFASILSLQPYTHLHIYQSFYVSTYMYLFPYESTYLCFLSSSMFINICLSIYLFIDLHIYPIRSKKSTKHKLCNLIQSKLFLSQFHYY